ncbi:MAG: contractile injection system tape measure protein, partial [Bacteroidota bacterium]
MTSTDHLIERIGLEATLPRADFRTQEALSGWLREVAVPAIAALADELLPPGATVRAEQLEVNLGHLRQLDPELPADRKRLRELLITKLREVLTELVRETAAAQRVGLGRDHFRGDITSGQGQRAERKYPDPNGERQDSSLDETKNRLGTDQTVAGASLRVGSSRDIRESDPPTVNESGEIGDAGATVPAESTKSQSWFEQWLYFLEYGSLPWWGRPFPPATTWPEWLGAGLRKFSHWRGRLEDLLIASLTARERLAQDARHFVVLDELLAEYPALERAWRRWQVGVDRLRKEIEKTPDLPLSLTEREKELTLRLYVWRQLLESSRDVTEDEHLARLVVSAWPHLPREDQEYAALLTRYFGGLPSGWLQKLPTDGATVSSERDGESFHKKTEGDTAVVRLLGPSVPAQPTL